MRRGSIAGSGRCRRVAFEPVATTVPLAVCDLGEGTVQSRGPWRPSKCWPRETVESRSYMEIYFISAAAVADHEFILHSPSRRLLQPHHHTHA